MQGSALTVLMIVGAILVVALLLVAFVIPTEVKKKKAKRPRVSIEELEARLEKALKTADHRDAAVKALRKQIEDWEKKDRAWQQQISEEQAKSAQLTHKLEQERQWQGEEAKKHEKKLGDVQRFQKDLKFVNEQLAEEHSVRLKLEAELRDLRDQYANLNEQRRVLELDKSRLTEKLEDCQRQIREYKKENAELSKKNDDTTWVAKNDYLKIERRVKELEGELRRSRGAGDSRSQGSS
jgi:chromosome segregation ATPase